MVDEKKDGSTKKGSAIKKEDPKDVTTDPIPDEPPAPLMFIGAKCSLLMALIALLLWLLSPYVFQNSDIIWYAVSAGLVVVGVVSAVVLSKKKEEDPDDVTTEHLPDEPPKQ
jgi:hypothetical protein